MRNRIKAAEARAEKAERERDEAIKLLRKMFRCAGYKNLNALGLCQIERNEACFSGNDRYEFAVK